MVKEYTGMAVQPHKAIVGANAFAHEAGIHQHGVLNERTTYEIMDPAAVGQGESQLVLGKHSGRAAFRDALQKLGHDIQGDALNAAFTRFKELADRKVQLTDADLEALVDAPAAPDAARVPAAALARFLPRAARARRAGRVARRARGGARRRPAATAPSAAPGAPRPFGSPP